MKKIEVTDKGYIFNEIPITVQRFESDGDDEYLEWCNHAGAIQETETIETHNPNGADHVFTQDVILCNKCDAVRYVGDDKWGDAPYGGVHNE